MQRSADGLQLHRGIVSRHELVPVTDKSVVLGDKLVMLINERRPGPSAVLSLHHAERFNPRVGDLVAEHSDVLHHSGDKSALLLQLVLQFGDASVALLDVVLKLADAFAYLA